MNPLYSHHPNRTIRAAATLVWVTLMLSPAPGLAAPPAIYNLGTLGGTISGGSAVNDAGQVAGYSYTAGNLAIRAFRYDGTPGSGGVMRDLGTFGGTYSGGHAINNAGQVAGSANLTGDDANHAFRYDGTPGAGGVMHDLDTLDGFYSAGLGINDAGQVAGSRGTRAFRYDGTPGTGGIMHDLGTLGGESYGVAVNDAGQVAGQSHITGSTNFHAFRYDGTPGAGGVMRDLGTLGGTQSYGVAINDAGQVAGLSRITGDTVSHAFLYTGTPGAGGIMHDLGTLGGAESVASGINDAGQVVGRSTTGAWFDHAFHYTGTPGVDGQMIDLDTWLDANNSTEGAKWTLTGASGLSNTGWITGAGLYDPDGPGGIAAGTRAYLLDASALVPQPSGDFNRDGTVDAADYVVWRDALGGAYDETHYTEWQQNFGATAVGAAAVADSAAVPEPAAGALALLGSILLLRRRSLWRPNKFLWAPGGCRARRQIMRSNVCAFLAILLCASAAARAFAAASLTPLGGLPGGSSHSLAYGVSGDGSVVVGYGTSASGHGIEAFRWTSDGGMVGLGYPPGGSSLTISEAYGVSADGSVIVGYSNSGYSEAFRWTSDGGMVGLGGLPGDRAAYGVSADGSVIVGSGTSGFGYEAFRWTSDGGMVGLGHLPGGAFYSRANGVSADGSVIVGSSDSASGFGYEAFRWTSGGGMVGLGDLPGGAFESWAEGVNGDGSVVVGYSSSASGREAFHWTSDGGMMGLGKLPGGINSLAHGVSGDGSVVVGWNDLDPGFGAFYWTADGGMQSLWDVLISHGVDPAADGWTELGSARGISADGNTIVGWGVRNGNFEAFVAVIPTIVPEPATGALALLGVSSILLLRRRSLGRPIKLKVLPFQALAGALTLIAAAPAAAIDTEPLNNSQLRADSLALSAPGTAVSNFAQLGGAGGDVDFFQTPLAAGEVLFGMVTPLAGLPSGVGLPETMVSVFDDSGRRTFNDLEDIGGGEGSIFRFLSPAAADYRIGVSGCCDFAFDGAASGFSHVESGGYILTAGRVNPVVPGGGFADTDPANQSAAGADLIALFPGAARVAVAQLIDSDVDFFRLDLKAGDVLSAMTAPLANLGVSFDRPDTLLGLFDSSGTNLLVENDDAGGETSIAIMNSETGEFDSTSGSTDFPFDGASWGSALRAYIPADGTYYLAVTGTFDDGFAGAHFETGAYALLVGLAPVPEPSSLALLTFAVAALLVRHRSHPHRTARRCW